MVFLFSRHPAVALCECRFHLARISSHSYHTEVQSIRTLQGLLSSNPAGARTVSDCPRSMPVSRLSRSITTFHLVSDSALSCATSSRHDVCPGSAHLCFHRVLCLSHASIECLGLLPPFCMCLSFERAAPDTPNICSRVCQLKGRRRVWCLVRTASIIP